MKKPAIFLDRDGVINRDRPDYVKSWAEFEFLPGVLEALRQLAATPYAIVVVTNQSAIGKGLVSQAAVDGIHNQMLAAVDEAGGRIDALYYCPHHPQAGCDCRKPRPGLLMQAAGDLGLDLSQSWLIGDSLRDLQCAVAAGVRPILVRTGHGEMCLRIVKVEQIFEFAFTDLLEAVNWLLTQQCGRYAEAVP